MGFLVCFKEWMIIHKQSRRFKATERIGETEPVKNRCSVSPLGPLGHVSWNYSVCIFLHNKE